VGRINRIIPFGLWPANWGLTGKRREELEAEYHYEGVALERKLNKIRNPADSMEFKLEELRLDLADGKLSEEQYDRCVLALTHTDEESEEYQLEELALDAKYQELTEQEIEKREATIKGEPWFDVLRSGYRPLNDDTAQMAFELDWNDEFVRFLESQGWKGFTDDEIVDKWFSEACRQMIMQDELVEEETNALPLVTNAARTRKTPGSEGRTEYS
jgi:hypothetical protein